MLTKEAKHRISLDRVAAHPFCLAQVPVFAANPQAYIPSETSTAAAASAPAPAIAPAPVAAVAAAASSSDATADAKTDC